MYRMTAAPGRLGPSIRISVALLVKSSTPDSVIAGSVCPESVVVTVAAK
jgi:hypothetical protein